MADNKTAQEYAQKRTKQEQKDAKVREVGRKLVKRFGNRPPRS